MCIYNIYNSIYKKQNRIVLVIKKNPPPPSLIVAETSVNKAKLIRDNMAERITNKRNESRPASISMV